VSSSISPDPLPVRSKSAWDTARINHYLDSSEHPLRISIISAGRPLIVPLWYEFDGQVFWCASPAHAKVVKLISKDGRCGFDLSDNAMPYRGVRGQGTAAIVSERGGDVLTRLIQRYLKRDDTAFARWLISRRDEEVAIRIQPEWITAWDFSDRMPSA